MLRNAYYLRRILRIRPKTIIHVGSHKAQDFAEYQKLGITEIYWCEADPELTVELRNKFGDKYVREGLFWSKPGLKIKFFRARDSQQSSAIPFTQGGTVQINETVDLISCTLDQVFEKDALHHPILLVLDIQGAELEVLKGAEKILNKAEGAIVEISRGPDDYVEVPSEFSIDNFMTKNGFKKSISRIGFSSRYKDQLYLKWGKPQILAIEVIDRIFDLLFRIFHLFKTGHWQGIHYHCQKCMF